MRERTKRTHPSYGVITVHRATGDFEHLFQSSVGGNTGICLEIHEADVSDTGLGDDHVMARKQIVEVHLSPLQWAEHIDRELSEILASEPTEEFPCGDCGGFCYWWEVKGESCSQFREIVGPDGVLRGPADWEFA